MEIVLQINGGIGKSVMATAVCKAIKTQYPAANLIVITTYPEIFTGNRNVYKTRLPNENAYFWLEYIKDKPDNKFFFYDPYLHTDFIQRKGHLIEVWCNMNGIKYNGELPELVITHKEKTEIAASLQSPKPIMVLQSSGGLPNQKDRYSWPRDMPPVVAQRIVNEFAKDYNIFHMRRQDQLPLQNTYAATADFRTLAVLMLMSQKRVLIDSFGQHVAAALGLPSVVCWIANTPQQFGYDMHTNIIANPPTVESDLRNSILAKYNISGPPSEFPYNSEEEIFDLGKIIDAVRGDKKEVVEAGSKKKMTPVA